MSAAGDGRVDTVIGLPPGPPGSEAYAEAVTVREYGHVVLVSGVGMPGGCDLPLPYPWIERNSIMRGADLDALGSPDELCAVIGPPLPPAERGSRRSGRKRHPDRLMVRDILSIVEAPGIRVTGTRIRLRPDLLVPPGGVGRGRRVDPGCPRGSW
ncbi:hypothetical protein GCM10010331_16460 [Streptomyces xanthochromogenes]|nr:hypothetical protein GCM10010331_16460 [Streptomyces xanthochromogenes]